MLRKHANYIGEISRHMKTHLDEHTKKDKMSHVYKHLHESEIYFHNYNKECFPILDTDY